MHFKVTSLLTLLLFLLVKKSLSFDGFFTQVLGTAGCNSLSGYTNKFTANFSCPPSSSATIGPSNFELFVNYVSPFGGFCFDALNGCYDNTDANFGGVSYYCDPDPPISCGQGYNNVTFSLLGYPPFANATATCYFNFCYNLASLNDFVGGAFSTCQNCPSFGVPNPTTGNKSCPNAFEAVPFMSALSPNSNCCTIDNTYCNYTLFYCSHVASSNGFTGSTRSRPNDSVKGRQSNTRIVTIGPTTTSSTGTTNSSSFIFNGVYSATGADLGLPYQTCQKSGPPNFGNRMNSNLLSCKGPTQAVIPNIFVYLGLSGDYCSDTLVFCDNTNSNFRSANLFCGSLPSTCTTDNQQNFEVFALSPVDGSFGRCNLSVCWNNSSGADQFGGIYTVLSNSSDSLMSSGTIVGNPAAGGTAGCPSSAYEPIGFMQTMYAPSLSDLPYYKFQRFYFCYNRNGGSALPMSMFISYPYPEQVLTVVSTNGFGGIFSTAGFDSTQTCSPYAGYTNAYTNSQSCPSNSSGYAIRTFYRSLDLSSGQFCLNSLKICWTFGDQFFTSPLYYCENETPAICPAGFSNVTFSLLADWKGISTATCYLAFCFLPSTGSNSTFRGAFSTNINCLSNATIVSQAVVNPVTNAFTCPCNSVAVPFMNALSPTNSKCGLRLYYCTTHGATSVNCTATFVSFRPL